MRKKSIRRFDAGSSSPIPRGHRDGWRKADRTAAHDGHPSHRLRVITVTGTSGKTTTAWLTAAVLAEAGCRVGVLSDLGCLGLDDDVPTPSDYACKGRLTHWLRQLADGGCSHVIVELSSEAIKAGALAGLRSDTVVVTSMSCPTITHRHDDLIAPARASGEAVGTLTADGCLIAGVSPRRLSQLRRRLPVGATSVTAGLARTSDITATHVEAGLFGRMVLASCGGQIMPLTLDPPVVPFVRDCLLAAAVGARYGIPLDVAVRGLEAAGGVPGRLERLARGQDAAVFLDMPSTGHALSATLASLRRLTPGRLAVVADERLVARLGEDEFGPLVARHGDACILVPPTVLSDTAGEREFTAYARIDRLLGSLGADDCMLVLGDSRDGVHPAEASPLGRFPLAELVDGWLQIAHGLPPIPARNAA